MHRHTKQNSRVTWFRFYNDGTLLPGEEDTSSYLLSLSLVTLSQRHREREGKTCMWRWVTF